MFNALAYSVRETARPGLNLLLMALLLSMWMLVPASLWFRVGSVLVMDARMGEAPRMEVQRTIAREFTAKWLVSIERKNASDGFSLHCVSPEYVTDYKPTRELPPDLDLKWWFGDTLCVLTPGEYRVVTRWKIHPMLFPPRTVEAVSNTFTIRPAALQQP